MGKRHCYVRDDEHGRTFMCGDLGKHCADCADVAGFLCDYPMGRGLTCDRPICDQHGMQVGENTHYCRDHAAVWRAHCGEQGMSPLLRPILYDTDPMRSYNDA